VRKVYRVRSSAFDGWLLCRVVYPRTFRKTPCQQTTAPISSQLRVPMSGNKRSCARRRGYHGSEIAGKCPASACLTGGRLDGRVPSKKIYVPAIGNCPRGPKAIRLRPLARKGPLDTAAQGSNAELIFHGNIEPEPVWVARRGIDPSSDARTHKMTDEAALITRFLGIGFRVVQAILLRTLRLLLQTIQIQRLFFAGGNSTPYGGLASHRRRCRLSHRRNPG